MNEIEIFSKKGKPNVREMAVRNGIEFPSDEELLMLILNGGTKSMPLEKLAEKSLSVINEGPSKDLVERLIKIPGMGIAKALALAAAVELGASNRMKPRPYLKPAATNYTSEYKLITETVVAKKM